MIGKYFLSLIFFSNLFYLCKMIENTDQLTPGIIIQGTYYGGCGFAFMKKKGALEDIKKYLTAKYQITNDNIKILMYNYDTENSKETVYQDKNNFNINEFNIFGIDGTVRVLMGTSDQSISDVYYSYLQYGMKQDKEKFLISICDNITKFYSNSTQSIY